MNNENAKIFTNEWFDRGDEDSDTQIFWLTLLRDVFDIDCPEKIISFQKSVGNKKIDAYIAPTKVLIEQKSFEIDLNKKSLQSDGENLTPYEQARRYAENLSDIERPNWIITCNFAEFHIYDLRKNFSEPDLTIILLRDLRYDFQRLKFLVDPNADTKSPAEKISRDALELIGKIYDAFEKNYLANHIDDYKDTLNKICMRLVFCLYADDANIFPSNQFFHYLNQFDDDKRLAALQNLFLLLNTPEYDRPQNLSPTLKAFPYVNGGLFDENLIFPSFNPRTTNPIASIGALNARKKFRWHEINPPIFGAMFESTFKRENTQRLNGMFYTSVENIHRVIDTLFLDDLRDEFFKIKRQHKSNKQKNLLAFQNKIAKMSFFEEKRQLESEMAVLVDMVNNCIAENARIAQDQEEYQKRYDGMVAKYDAAKTKFDETIAAISAKEAQSARLTAFVKALRERSGIIEDFDESLWGCTVEYVTVGRKKGMTVTFRDGTEIQA